MKTILALCAAVLLAAAALAYRHSRLPDDYGAFTGAPEVAVAELARHPQNYLKKDVTAQGLVREQCTSMGCYFFFHDGDASLRVDLQDVAMTAPRKNGRPARVEGRMVKYGDGYQLWASAVHFE